MRATRYWLCGLLLLLGGCEAPDVQPFATATHAMGQAVDGSLTRVEADLRRVQLPAVTQQRQLDSLRQVLGSKAQRFRAAAHAFDAYADALAAAAAAGQQRGAAIDRVFAATQEVAHSSAGFLATALPATAPVSAVAAPLLQALGRVAHDLNAARTTRSLRTLASARQDSAVQLAAQALQLGVRHYYHLDSLAYALLQANPPAAYESVRTWYALTLRRQPLLTDLLGALVQTEGYVRAGEAGLLSNPAAHDGPLDRVLAADADPQRQVARAARAWQQQPTARTQAALLAALHQRELFYRPLAELPQAQLDAARARYLPPPPDTALLPQTTRLLGAWASTHHELHLLLASRRPARQDLLAYAQLVQALADKLQAARRQ